VVFPVWKIFVQTGRGESGSDHGCVYVFNVSDSEAMQAAARPRVAWHNLRNFVNLSTLTLLKALVYTSRTSWFPALTTVCRFPDSKQVFANDSWV